MTARPPTDGRVSSDRHVIAFGLGVLLVAALVVFLPDLTPPAGVGLISDQAHGVIVTIVPPTGPQGPTGTVKFLDGPQAGQTVPATIEGPSGALQIPDYHVGDEVLVAIDHLPDGTTQVSVVDRWRLPLIGGLVGLFALVTIAVAGWRGLRALVSLALTLVLAIRVLIPLLLSGWQPVGLAISLGILITAVSFLLTQGFTRATLAAILGTSIGLGLTGLLAVVVTGLAQFTPAQGSETVIYLQQIVGDKIDLSGLLLAAVIFGALGVLNDVAIGQAATVEELALADPGLSRRAAVRPRHECRSRPPRRHGQHARLRLPGDGPAPAGPVVPPARPVQPERQPGAGGRGDRAGRGRQHRHPGRRAGHHGHRRVVA